MTLPGALILSRSESEQEMFVSYQNNDNYLSLVHTGSSFPNFQELIIIIHSLQKKKKKKEEKKKRLIVTRNVIVIGAYETSNFVRT